jgi:hypothetical protein
VRLFFTLLLAAAGAAAAQETKETKPQLSQERPAAPAPSLNLKLDNPGQYAREAPREGGGEPLPSLGADARVVTPAPTAPSTKPFPKDTERREQ